MPTCSCSGERLLAVAWPQTRPMPLGFKVRFGRAGRLGCGIRRAAEVAAWAGWGRRGPTFKRAGILPESLPSGRVPLLPSLGSEPPEAPWRDPVPGRPPQPRDTRSLQPFGAQVEMEVGARSGGARGTPRPRTYSSGASARARGPDPLPGRPRGEAGQRAGFAGGWARAGASAAHRGGTAPAPGAGGGRRAPAVCSAPRRTAGHRTAPGRGSPRRTAAWETRAPFLCRG